MRVREYHAFSCQLIRVWCFDFSMILVQTLYIAIAQVIAENNDDIGIGPLETPRTRCRRMLLKNRSIAIVQFRKIEGDLGCIRDYFIMVC